MTKEIQQTISPYEWWKQEIHLRHFNIEKNSLFLDKNGNVFEDVYAAEKRSYLPFEDIPTNILHAFIAVEDQSFYEHRGIDITGIGRALVVNIGKESIEEGGSTITQQLARNLFLSSEKKYERKLKELLLAYKLEDQFSKEDILEFYINKIYFHNGVYGIEAASLFYFGKSSKHLSLAEAAFLTAIPNNPTLYNPLTNEKQTKKRQEHILQSMLTKNYIAEDQFEEAVNNPIQLNIHEPIHQFPDYTDVVYREFKALIAEKEGYRKQLQKAKTEEDKAKINKKIEKRAYEWLYEKGVRIHTSLDPALQTIAVDTVNAQLRNKQVESSVVIIDHEVNSIVAVVSGKQYKRNQFNRAIQTYRQPGSAIKPLLVFAPYIEETKASTNQLINASHFCKNGFCPKNYGNASYNKVTLENAFISSINTAAVRLMNKTGVKQSFAYLEPFSFDYALKGEKNLASAIGGFTHGVNPVELTNAYTTFANDGTYTPSYTIQKVTNAKGELLFEWNRKEKQVWSKGTNDKLRRLLQKTITSGTASRAYVSKSYVGGKTGTTNAVKDLWFIGLTDQYTAGVWVGRDDGKSVAPIENDRPHLYIWKNIMSKN